MKRKILSLIMPLLMVAALFPTITAQAAMKTVTVSTADELLAAIDSDTKIILKPGKYEITSETYTDSWGTYRLSRNLYIADINNLEICGNGQAEIVLDVGNMGVIETYNSSNITFDGLTLGHDVPNYGCQGEGNVFQLIKSNNVKINNCDMYGCGVYGIRSGESSVTVTDSTIRDCMMGIALLFNDITFNRCSFLRNAYDPFFANTTSAFNTWSSEPINVICNDCNFEDNLNTTFSSDNMNVITNDCSFVNNEWEREKQPLKADVTYTVEHYWDNDEVLFEIISSDPDNTYAAVDRRRGLTLYLAEYDKFGTLINVSTENFQSHMDPSPYSYAYVELPKTENYKYMIWDENMCPLIEPITNIYN